MKEKPFVELIVIYEPQIMLGNFLECILVSELNYTLALSLSLFHSRAPLFPDNTCLKFHCSKSCLKRPAQTLIYISFIKWLFFIFQEMSDTEDSAVNDLLLGTEQNPATQRVEKCKSLLIAMGAQNVGNHLSLDDSDPRLIIDEGDGKYCPFLVIARGELKYLRR